MIKVKAKVTRQTKERIIITANKYSIKPQEVCRKSVLWFYKNDMTIPEQNKLKKKNTLRFNIDWDVPVELFTTEGSFDVLINKYIDAKGMTEIKKKELVLDESYKGDIVYVAQQS